MSKADGIRVQAKARGTRWQVPRPEGEARLDHTGLSRQAKQLMC